LAAELELRELLLTTPVPELPMLRCPPEVWSTLADPTLSPCPDAVSSFGALCWAT
jgi:hypothetical protein